MINPFCDASKMSQEDCVAALDIIQSNMEGMISQLHYLADVKDTLHARYSQLEREAEARKGEL